MLRVAKGVVEATFRTLRGCGLGRCECVVYWTGPSGDSIVDIIEHPIHERSPFGFVVDDGWITDFWKKLAASHRSVKAQVHTHPGRAFHSPTDDEWPIVSQPGFLSLVVPDFAAGAPSLERAWIGQLGPRGKWEELSCVSEAVLIP